MKSKFIGFSFLFLSMILLFIWFQINNETQKLEEKLSDLDERIILMKESNKVLLSEFSAHTNPEYIEKLSLVYLDVEKNDKEKNYIMSKKGFFNKIKLMQMIMPTSIHDQIISKTKKVEN